MPNKPEFPGDLLLSDKVKQWIETEGYPLEFRTASIFQRAGFGVSQGLYVRDHASRETREIDVLADVTIHRDEGRFFRISQIVECKWSKDKPWVVLTSSESIMAPSACIAQSIASSLGEAAAFCLAGDSNLQGLDLFKCPERGGFAGRRAFEKQDKQDQFFRTIQVLVANAVSRAKSYDECERAAGEMPRSGLIVFPVIVVDGSLFEAYYNATNDELKLNEAEQIRLLWRGSSANRRAITAVDIVTANALNRFASKRASDVKVLVEILQKGLSNIDEAFQQQSFKKLVIKRGPRGFTGLPPLLAELYLMQEGKVSKPANLKE